MRIEKHSAIEIPEVYQPKTRSGRGHVMSLNDIPDPWSFHIVRNKMDKKNLQWLVRKINESYKEWLKIRVISNTQKEIISTNKYHFAS